MTSYLLIRPLRFLSFLIAFLALSNSSIAQYKVTTSVQADENSFSIGGLFNVSSNQTIRLDTIYFPIFLSNYLNVELWYKETPILSTPDTADFEANIGIWKNKIVKVTASSQAGMAAIEIPSGIVIPAGKSFGFYVGRYKYTAGFGISIHKGVLSPINDSVISFEPFVGSGSGWNRVNNVLPTANLNTSFIGGVAYTVLTKGLNDLVVKSIDSIQTICEDSKSIYATIANYGKNVINSAQVNWSVNGILQTPVNFSGFIDTLGGLASFEAKVSLGNFFFTGINQNEIKVWTSLPNGVLDTRNYNDTLEKKVHTSLTGGNYTINSNATSSATNFTSFSALFDKIADIGICSSITVDVVSGSGPYLERVSLEDFKGAPNRQLIINGNGESLIFSMNADTNTSTLKIENSSYITIDSLTIESSGIKYGDAMSLNNVTNIVISNCVFKVDSTANSANISGVRIGQKSERRNLFHVVYPSYFKDVNFVGNKFYGGGKGIQVSGLLDLTASGFMLNQNSFRGFTETGIFISSVRDLMVESNSVHHAKLGYDKTVNGIEIWDCYGLKVNKNAIHNIGMNALFERIQFTALYIRSYGNYNQSSIVSNNLVYNIRVDSISIGIYDFGSDYINFSNNTIVLDGTNAPDVNYTGIYVEEIANKMEFQNNLISITSGGSGSKYGLRQLMDPKDSSRVTYPIALRNNNIYVNSLGTGVKSLLTLGSRNVTLEELENLEVGESNLSVDPVFKSLVSDNYSPTNPVLSAMGLFNPLVLDDFNGEVRNSFKNDIGAILMESPVLDASIQSFDLQFPACRGNINYVVVQNNGKTKIDSLIFNWSVDNVIQSTIVYKAAIDTIGSVRGNQGLVLLGSYSFDPLNVVELKAWITSPNGQINDDNVLNDTLIKKYRPPLSGRYSLDANSPVSAKNFTSLTDFATTISKWGMCGNVTLDIIQGSGPYTETALFNAIPKSLNDTLRIFGNGEELIYNNQAKTTIAALGFIDCKDVIINNLFVTLSNRVGSGIRMADVENVEISDCKIYADSLYSPGSIGINVSKGDYYLTATSGNNLRFVRNKVKHTYSAINIEGNDFSTIKNVEIVDNVIQRFFSSGISIKSIEDGRLENNELSNVLSTRDVTGINTESSTNLFVNRNSIHNIKASGALNVSSFIGIESNNAPELGSENYIMNNIIYDISSFSLATGLTIRSGKNEKIFNNTISLNQSNLPSIGIHVGGLNSFYELTRGIEISNNIIHLSKSGLRIGFPIQKYAFRLSNFGAMIGWNNVFVEKSNDNFYAFDGDEFFKNINDFQDVSYGKNDITVDPKFKDLENGDLSPLNYRLKGTGKPNSKVTEDFYGAPRNPLALDRGAIAFTQPNLEVSVDSFNVPAALCPGTYPLSLFVSNEGFNRIDSLTVNYEINGVLLNSKSDHSIIENYLSVNSNVGEIPLGGFSINENDTIRLKAWLTSVNGQIGDEYARNDTLEYTVVGKRGDVFNLNASSKIYNFEIGDQCWTTNGTNSSWQWGAPNSSFISAANTGVNAWVTNLTGNHNANELSYLESPSLDLSKIEASQPLQIQFFTSFSSEQSNDKMWLESSIDSGNTWQKVVPSLTANNFYNNSATQVWEGQSQGTNGWIPVSNEMLGLSGNANVKLRFAFQSNGSNQQDGFGIDDVQLNLLIGVPEIEQKAFSMLMYPNPTNGDVKLEFNNSSIGEYMIRVFSISGKLMLERRVSILDKNQQTEALQLTNMTKGIYFVQVIGENGGVTKKLIVR